MPIVTPARAIRDGIELGLAPARIAQAIRCAQEQELLTARDAQVLRQEAGAANG